MKIVYLDYPKALCITDCISWEIGAQTVDYIKEMGVDLDIVYIELEGGKTARDIVAELTKS